MEDLQVYLVNLGKYNEGESVGAWFHLPLDKEEVSERLGLNEVYEEYAVHDYEMPMDLPEYISVDALNEIYENLCCLDEDGIEFCVIDEMIGICGSLEELVEHREDIQVYPDVDDEVDLAYYFVEECNSEWPELAKRYFDYKAYGRDLLIEGHFIFGKNGAYEICL